MFIPTDFRIWEVFDDKGKSLGAFLYGDMIIQFSHNETPAIKIAYGQIEAMGYTHKVIGSMFPLEEKSENELINEIRSKWIAKEQKQAKRANLKHLKDKFKKGFKMSSVLNFGKCRGRTVQYVFDNERAYFRWLMQKGILLTHPEVDAAYETIKF